MKRIIPLLVFAAILVPAFSFVFAAPAGSVTEATPVMSTLTNPLKVTSIGALYKNILSIVVQVGYVVVAFFLLLSGFKFVTAQGSESKLEDAKKTFYGTIIGAIIVIGAQTIFAILESVVKSLNK